VSRSFEGAWIGTTTAAEILGVASRTLYRLIDSGSLPAYRIGRVIRLRHHELEDYIQTLRVQPGELAHLYPPIHPDGPPTDGPDPDRDMDSDAALDADADAGQEG
jgi:excisionase family DNA binding protein